MRPWGGLAPAPADSSSAQRRSAAARTKARRSLQSARARRCRPPSRPPTSQRCKLQGWGQQPEHGDSCSVLGSRLRAPTAPRLPSPRRWSGRAASWRGTSCTLPTGAPTSAAAAWAGGICPAALPACCLPGRRRQTGGDGGAGLTSRAPRVLASPPPPAIAGRRSWRRWWCAWGAACRRAGIRKSTTYWPVRCLRARHRTSRAAARASRPQGGQPSAGGRWRVAARHLHPPPPPPPPSQPGRVGGWRRTP